MYNVVYFLPLPAILLLLFLLINIVVIVVLRQRFSAQELERSEPTSATVTEIKKAKPKRKEEVVQTKSSGLFYIFGVLSWIVLLWPIIIFLNAKSQAPSPTRLTEDGIMSTIPALSQKQCDRITFFDEEGRQVAAEGISDSLLPGDTILIAVKPREGEEADKARVRVNSSLWTEDNEIREKSTEGFFIFECLVDVLSDGRPTVCGMPVGKRGKFAVEAEIYDAKEGVWN